VDETADGVSDLIANLLPPLEVEVLEGVQLPPKAKPVLVTDGVEPVQELLEQPPACLGTVQLLLQRRYVDRRKGDVEVLSFLPNRLDLFLKRLPFLPPLLHFLRGLQCSLHIELVHTLRLQCLPPRLKLLQSCNGLLATPLNILPNDVLLLLDHIVERCEVALETLPARLYVREVNPRPSHLPQELVLGEQEVVYPLHHHLLRKRFTGITLSLRNFIDGLWTLLQLLVGVVEEEPQLLTVACDRVFQTAYEEVA
jgi:hypothetical protein